jgi:hypothetical protein
MADVASLLVTDATEQKLWAHGLALADALEVLDAGEFWTFADTKSDPRRYMIGPDSSGRLITLIIEAVDDEGTCVLVTGWPSNTHESTLFSRPGGTQYAGRPTTSHEGTSGADDRDADERPSGEVAGAVDPID